MTEKTFDMKSALRYAIHSEYHASTFYRQWAEEVSGAAGEKLGALAEWEDQHRRSLSGYYARLFGEEVVLDPSFGVDPALVVQADEFRNHSALLRIASSYCRRSSESTTNTRTPGSAQGTSWARVRGEGRFSRAVIPAGQSIHGPSSAACT